MFVKGRIKENIVKSMSNLLNNYDANLRLLDDDNGGDIKDGWKENEIEGSGGPKDPADVELFPIEKADLFLNNYEMADSSLSGGSGGGYIDAGSNRGFVSPQQAQSMLDNPSAFGGLSDQEVMLLREGLNIPGV